jgi:hypothetical protein
MDDFQLLEKSYKKFIGGIQKWTSDAIRYVDLSLLHQFNLLNYHSHKSDNLILTRYFQIIETYEKITLINEDFVVWIVPEKLKNRDATYTIIALNLPETLHFELAFIATGIYNSSTIVLRVLEKYLEEIQETENFLKKFS